MGEKGRFSMQSTIQLTRPLIISIPFFSQKIFEPLKRLLSAVSSLLQKMYCTASTHLCFGRCAVTGGLRCALHCLPAYAQMCELKAGKPGGSQDIRACRKDCCRAACLQCSSARRGSSCRREQHGQDPTHHLADR